MKAKVEMFKDLRHADVSASLLENGYSNITWKMHLYYEHDDHSNEDNHCRKKASQLGSYVNYHLHIDSLMTKPLLYYIIDGSVINSKHFRMSQFYSQLIKGKT